VTASPQQPPSLQKGAFTEREFELLARTLDELPVQHHPLFLARLVVILSARIADFSIVRDAVERARTPADRA